MIEHFVSLFQEILGNRHEARDNIWKGKHQNVGIVDERIVKKAYGNVKIVLILLSAIGVSVMIVSCVKMYNDNRNNES